MANPAQGALSQMKPPQQAGGKFDAGAAQAENIEKINESAGLKESVTDDLSDQREAMNNILLRLRAGLDTRKNRMFDPVLMQAAAGFLKPTKTGSFGESLGYAAENAGAASEREMLHERENQKMEMELAAKEMEFRQQLGGDAFVNKLLAGNRPAAPSGSVGSAPVTQAPGEAGRAAPPMVPANASPAPSAAGQNPQQVLSAAVQGRIKVTDEILLLAQRANPKVLATLQEMRRSQEAEEKNLIDRERLGVEREKLGQDKRKVVPHSLRTEREMNVAEYAEYQAKLKEYFNTGDDKALLEYYLSKGWLEQEQARNLVSKDGTRQKISDVDYKNLIAKTAQELTTDQKLAEQKALQPGEIEKARRLSLIKRAEEIAILTERARVDVLRDIEIAEKKLKINVQEAAEKTTVEARSKAAEANATKLATQADAAFGNINASNDIIAYAKNNPRITQAMNKPGIFGAVTRAAQEGISIGNYSVNVPSKTLSEANLTENDLTALQLLAQKIAELQTRGRQLNRTPGEGSTSDYETKLLGSIYALASDSQRALILKSEALKLQGIFDEDRFKLWSQKSKKPGYTYNDFMVDDDYRSLKSEYRETLDRVRDENVDLLSPKKKAPAAAPAASAPPPAQPPAPPPAAPPAPVATPKPTAVKPDNIITEKKETYSEKLKRLQRERGG